MTPAEEKRVARELSPSVAWPTLAMAAALPAAQWGMVALGLTGAVSPWALGPAIAVTSYAHYTLVHESIHDNLAPGHPRLRWLNAVVGWIGALGLGSNWPLLMRTHALHHAHTNTDEDPDIHVKGTLAQLLVKWLRLCFLNLVPLALLKPVAPARYRRIASIFQPGEVGQASAVAFGVLGLLAAAVISGQTAAWLGLLFLPTRVSGLLLMVFFQWLPHHPFDRTERYLNTRISLWAGGGVLLLQQNLHLMHHLWPSVPFYNYGRLYRRLRPVLIDRGSRIEGLLVGRFARRFESDNG
jgi:fatty acid desaturase